MGIPRTSLASSAGSVQARGAGHYPTLKDTTMKAANDRVLYDGSSQTSLMSNSAIP